MQKLKVFSTPTCPWCTRAKDFLRENKIPFEEKNVAEDSIAAQEMMNKSGQMGVPVVEACEDVIVGFDSGRIMSAVRNCS